jgi:ligand-binding sensor domain-containing protein
VGLLAALPLAPAPAAAEELPFTHLTPDGATPLPSGSVQKLLQDRLGFLWMGFYSTGLARYDGHVLEPYSVADGLPDVVVRELVEDAQGRLWVGTEAGMAVSTRPLQEYAPTERIRFTPRVGTDALPARRQRRNCLVLGADGWVWQGTGGEGLAAYRVRDGKLETRTVSTDLFDSGKHEPVTSLLARRDGTLWAALARGVWLRVAADGSTTLLDPQEHGGARRGILTTAEGPSGALWVGYADGGVARVHLNGPRASFEDMRSPLRERVSALHESPDGDLWAASLGTGVARFSVKNDRTPEHYTRADGLLSDTFWHLLADRSGALWLAQNGGLSRLSADFRAFGRFTKNTLADPSVFASLPPGAVASGAGAPGARVRTALCPAGKGARAVPPTWLGTGRGLVALCEGKVAATLGLEEGLASLAVYSLHQDADGRLWVGTAQGVNAVSFDPSAPPPPGASQYKSVQVLGRTAQVSGFPLGGGPVYGIRPLRLRAEARGAAAVDTLWLAGAGGLWALLDESWLYFGPASGLNAEAASGVEVDPEGRLWAASVDQGLFRTQAPLTAAALRELAVAAQGSDGLSLEAMVTQTLGEVSRPVFEPAWSTANGAPSNGMRHLARAGDRLLVGTTAGLVLLDPSTRQVVARHDATTGLGGNTVVGIARSPVTRHLWVSQNGGLAELDAEGRRVLRVLTEADGLSDDEAWAYNTLVASADGTVHLATPHGLSLVRPALLRPHAAPPQLRWTRISERPDAAGRLALTAGFTALAFDDPRGVRYQARLVGDADEGWGEPSPHPRVRYTHLPRGSYTLEVRASVGGGPWSEPLRHPFTVPPPARTAR